MGKKSLKAWLPLILTIVLYGIVFFKNMWACDDAYISFRSIEQLFAGNGPRWNPHERVQVFTSPLWFWVMSVARLFSRDYYLNTQVVSLLCSIGLIFFLKKTLQSIPMTALALLLLLSSNSFFDFTSSGLENPLAFVLIMAFLLLYTKSKTKRNDNNFINLLSISFIFSLLLVCRQDLITLVIPPYLYLLFSKRKDLRLKQFLLLLCSAISIFGCWSVFSLIYYGTIFPNTAYAKLTTGIPRLDYIQQGLHYFAYMLLHDSLGFIILVFALISTLLSKKNYVRFLGLGLLLNLFYILSVGGDFMAGRFLSGAFLYAMTILLFYVLPEIFNNLRITESAFLNHKSITITVVISLLIGYGIFYKHTPINSPIGYSKKLDGKKYARIEDERGYYNAFSSIKEYSNYLIKYKNKKGYFPTHPWSFVGLTFAYSSSDYGIFKNIGFAGFWAGTEKTIIDSHALSDPLLARLPITDLEDWRIGHFKRKLPKGYLESLKEGKNLLQEQQIRDLYETLKIVTQDEQLFSLRRINAIWRLNTQ